MRMITAILFITCLFFIPLSLSCDDNFVTKGIIKIDGDTLVVFVTYVLYRPFVVAKVTDNVYVLISMDSYICSDNNCEKLGNVLAIMKQL